MSPETPPEVLHAIAVDDEPFALQLLADDLARISNLTLVSTCSTAAEALEVLNVGGIDLMFLDIQMPGLTGIQFLRTVPNPPLVIITTAYEHYAVEGFELDVVDYLVKPIPFDRLTKAVAKARERLQARHLMEKNRPGESFFFIRSEYKEIKIYFDDIHHIEGLKDYVKIFIEGHAHPVLTRMNLKAMESRLPAARFARVHNSYIVPLKKITAVQRAQVFLGDEAIPIGEKFYNDFMRLYRDGA